MDSPFLLLPPSKIRYTQDSIRNRFGRPGADEGKPIGDVLYEVYIGMTDLPPIEVFEYKGFYWSADNRRLWVFKELENLGKCNSMPVKLIPFKRFDRRKFTTKNDGQEVKIRGEPYSNAPVIKTVLESVGQRPVYRFLSGSEDVWSRQTERGGHLLTQGKFEGVLARNNARRIINHYIVIPEDEYSDDDDECDNVQDNNYNDVDDRVRLAGIQVFWSMTWNLAKWIAKAILWLLFLLVVLPIIIIIIIAASEKHGQ